MSRTPPLLVTVLSFGYHVGGCPDDRHGHGGGFVFDCRCLPNPGKLAEYADLDGRDAEVAVWLEASPAVHVLIAHAWGLVEAAVEAYGRKGFEHLQVAFGCTGGRHRSVYCAQKLYDMLREHGVEATLVHRELQASEEPKRRPEHRTPNIQRRTPK